MLNYLRNDFAKVRFAAKFCTNNKMPDWAIVIWYIIMLPIGLMLYPFVKLINFILLRWDD